MSRDLKRRPVASTSLLVMTHHDISVDVIGRLAGRHRTVIGASLDVTGLDVTGHLSARLSVRLMSSHWSDWTSYDVSCTSLDFGGRCWTLLTSLCTSLDISLDAPLLDVSKLARKKQNKTRKWALLTKLHKERKRVVSHTSSFFIAKRS